MKSPLSLILAVAAFQSLAAQQPTQLSSARSKGSVTITPNNRLQSPPVAPSSTVLYSQDFSAGIPGTWTINDVAGNGEVWQFTNVGTSGGGYLAPNGTTAANGYIMFDSDGGGQSSPAENCDITTNAISCTGQTQVFLSFNEFYQELASDSAYVGVSNDGVSWTYFYCPDTATIGGVTPNPNHVAIDISSVAANQATVYVKFHYEGNWDWYWLLDDIAVYVPDAQDAAAVMVNPVSPQYTRMPLAQAVNIPLTGRIKNMGGTSMSGATAVFEVIDTVTNTVVFNNSVSVPTLTPLAQVNLTSGSSFTASGNGYYRTRLRVIGVSGDAVPANDTAHGALVLFVNDSVFARDVNVMSGTLGIGAGPAQGIIGQNFMLNYTDVLTTVSIYLDSMVPAPGGSPVYVTIHPQAPGLAPGAAIATTDSLIVTPGMIPAGGAWYTLNISGGPLWLNSGLYFVGVHENDSLLPLALSPGIATPNTVWVTWNTIPSPPAVNGWATADDFGFVITYMIRPNFGTVVNSVEENNTNIFGVYPNPASDVVNLTFQQSETRTITVFNALGEVVTSFTSNETQVGINTSAWAAGVYTIQVTGESGNAMQSISVNPK